ncbi:MAG: FtsX-like permease family protein, partial [Bacteroidota bacterium]
HLLLGFQYTLAVILLVITLGMGRQLDYMRQKDMGFAQEQIMLVSLPEGEEETHSRIGELRDQLASTAIISQVALAGGGALPGEDNGKELFEIKSEGGIIEKVYNIYAIDDQYLPTLSIPLAEGRNFDPDRISDRNGAVLINEALAKALGWESPLGQQINCYGDWREVVGVVKDFHHQSLHNPIEPVVFLYDVSYASTLLVKAPLAATPLLESTFRTHFPDTPYTLSYFYQFIGALYQQEQRLSVLFRFFSMVALLLCGMGLFALFSLQVHQRTRELGIRKVLGARARHLLQNLFKSYRYTALIALAVGLPLAGWWIQVWLQDFSYRVTLGSSIYLMAIVWIIGVSLAVTSYHILKALRANPVESLKQE